MMNIKNFYFFYYFSLREFFRKGPANWAFESKAIITLCVLETFFFAALGVWIVAIFVGPFKVLIHPTLVTLSLVSVVLGVNYYILFVNNRSQKYFTLFRQLTRKEQSLGHVFSIIVTLALVLSVFVLYYSIGELVAT